MFLSEPARHLEALRTGHLKDLYSPTIPPRPMGLAVIPLTLLFLIVISGLILHKAYDVAAASSKSSSSGRSSSSSGGATGEKKGDDFVTREIAKRKAEKPEETKKRAKAVEAEFMGRLAKMDSERRGKEIERRKKEIEMLKKELARRKLPPTGLEWDWRKAEKSAKGKSSGGSEAKKDGGDKKDKDNEKEKAEKGEDKKEKPSALKSIAGKISGKDKDKDEGAVKAVKLKGGPGWAPADDAVAHAAIMGGAARAENMANNLVKQKA